VTDIDGVPVIPWADHLAQLDWRQGEHVALVGPTGQGKTTLALEILKRRKYVVYIATKAKDDTLNGLVRKGWTLLRRWPPKNDSINRVILWPQYKSRADKERQRAVIQNALDRIFAVGGWCVVADDTQYLTKHLHLGEDLNGYWLQARALGISVMGATQRPRNVPVEMWANSDHVYIWGTRQPDDLKALGGLAGVDAASIRRIVAQLPKYHVLYIPVRQPDAALHITKVTQ